jgi:hypothetical protein
MLAALAGTAGARPLSYSLESEVRYDSEVRARNEGLEDVSLHLRTTLDSEWKLGPAVLNARIGGDVIRFDKERELNEESVLLGLDLSPSNVLKNSRLVLSGNFSYDTVTRSDPYLGDFIRSRQVEAVARLKYDPNRRWQLLMVPSLSKQLPDTAPYEDQTVAKLALSGTLASGENGGLVLSVDLYESRLSDSSTPDTRSLTAHAGWRGGSPEGLSWFASTGLQTMERRPGPRSDNPFLSASAHWRINQRSSLSATATHGLQVYLDNSINEESRLAIVLTRDITRDWTGIASIIWSKDRLERAIRGNRKDDFVLASIRLTRQLTRRTSASLFVEISDRSSSDNTFKYDRLRSGIRWSGIW